jgi:hypothetical protein
MKSQCPTLLSPALTNTEKINQNNLFLLIVGDIQLDDDPPQEDELGIEIPGVDGEEVPQEMDIPQEMELPQQDFPETEIQINDPDAQQVASQETLFEHKMSESNQLSTQPWSPMKLKLSLQISQECRQTQIAQECTHQEDHQEYDSRPKDTYHT